MGSDIARYEIRGELGAGGMGVVHRAYDTRLERDVALKQVKFDELGSTGPEAEARLLREAQSMAQLSHPNVVPVFDVGPGDEGLYIAMELVDGQTLATWLRAEDRGWRAIVRALADAGRGLAAAHAVGLIHRDFKPSNVMIGAVGRARVMDFGLARVDASNASGDLPSRSSSGEELTTQGTVLGTPAYMAPEQHGGEDLDARADQFAFCATAWAALYGERPYRDGHLAQKKLAGPPEAPRGKDVPKRIGDVLRRGLAPQPDDRFASMDELLGALERDSSRNRLRAGVAIAGLGAVAAAIAIPAASEDPTCVRALEELDGNWDAASKERVASSLRGTGVAYAEATWTSVEELLDEHVTQWTRSYVDACEATHVTGEQSPEDLDLRIACLERSRKEFDALVSLLQTTDERVVLRAVAVAGALSPISRCDDLTALRQAYPPPTDPATAARVEAANDALLAALLYQETGLYREALAKVQALEDEVAALDFPPTSAYFHFALGSLLEATGEFDEAATHLEQAYENAVGVGADEVAADASRYLVQTYGVRQTRFEDAAQWAEHAEAAALRLGSDADRMARMHNFIGAYLDTKGETTAARERYLKAVAIREKIFEPDHPLLLVSRGNVANTYIAQGEYEVGRAALETILAKQEARYGRFHPSVATTCSNMGVAIAEQGHYDRAAVLFERALEIRTEVLGERHAATTDTMGNLGALYLYAKDVKKAKPLLEKALAIQQDVFGEDHPSLGFMLGNLGLADRIGENWAESEKWYAHALRLQEAGDAPDHPLVAYTLVGLGLARRKQGDPASAAKHLERALQIRQDKQVAPELVAEAQFHLAKARWDLGTDKPGAIALMRAAQSTYATAPDNEGFAEQARAWLAEHDHW